MCKSKGCQTTKKGAPQLVRKPTSRELPLASSLGVYPFPSKQVLPAWLAFYQDGSDCQNKEDDTQYNRDPEENFLNSPPRSKDSAGVATGKATQAGALALQDDAGDQGN